MIFSYYNIHMHKYDKCRQQNAQYSYIVRVFWVKIGQFYRFRLFNARKKKDECSVIIARGSALTRFSQAPWFHGVPRIHIDETMRALSLGQQPWIPFLGFHIITCRTFQVTLEILSGCPSTLRGCLDPIMVLGFCSLHVSQSKRWRLRLVLGVGDSGLLLWLGVVSDLDQFRQCGCWELHFNSDNLLGEVTCGMSLFLS